MLRPATPLTVLLFVSFVLLLLSVISTPIIKGIPLATFEGVNFGVFGFCTPQECSNVVIGYNTDGLFGDADKDPNFSLPSTARHSLSALLIVHPIAALFNLVCLGLAGAAHLHSPSHSARYLLALLILLLPTLLVTLLAFLVDILLFVPHLQWGGWIVLASTILITASGVVTCAMRRTLVSRKARKKRIAENAEMSGENFYNRQNTLPKTDASSQRTSVEPKPPMVNGALGANSLPAFTTFNREVEVSEERSDFSRISPTDRRDGSALGYSGSDGEALGPVRSRSLDQHRGAGDEYGNPVMSSDALGPATANLSRDRSDPNLRQSHSRERVNGLPIGPRGGSGYRGPRGRGGHPPRAGYGPPRGGFGGPRGRPRQGVDRGGYNDGRGNYHNGRGRGGPIAAGAMMGRIQQGPPPGYPPQGQRVSPEGYGSQGDLRGNPQGYNGASGVFREQSPGGTMHRPSPEMAPSPPQPPQGSFVGQAVEMNASTGRISQAVGRPEDGAAVHGIMTIPPNLPSDQTSPSSEYSSPGAMPRPPHMNPPLDLANAGGSMYINGPDAYVPPRAAWANNSRTNSPNREPHGVDPIELSSGSASGQLQTPARTRSSDYYEDVDPRFSDVNMDSSLPDQTAPLPLILTPGGPSAGRQPPPQQSRDFLNPPSDENLQDGGRSPTGSEISHYTSVSQRGVNPRWRPGSEDPRNMPPPNSMRKPVPPRGSGVGHSMGGGGAAGPARSRDVLLQGNPDFEIPGMRPPGRNFGPSRGGGGGGGGGEGPPVRVGMGMQPPPVLPNNGLTGVGRYPQP